MWFKAVDVELVKTKSYGSLENKTLKSLVGLNQIVTLCSAHKNFMILPKVSNYDCKRK